MPPIRAPAPTSTAMSSLRSGSAGACCKLPKWRRYWPEASLAARLMSLRLKPLSTKSSMARCASARVSYKATTVVVTAISFLTILNPPYHNGF